MPGLQMMFDLRRPAFSKASRAEIYATTLEMCKWADERGWDNMYFNEHHSAEDGYLPAPLIMCAAAAAVTSSVEIQAILIAPFYDPVRLAEELAVIDLVSQGRMVPILVGGYRSKEYDLFGVHITERASRVEQVVDFLRLAWTGEPFQFRGRTIQITPRPFRPGGPPLILGARTRAGARRAARFGDSMIARVHWDAYRDERIKLGKPDPGDKPRQEPFFLMVTNDPERSVHEVGRHVMHWNNSYNEWFYEVYGTLWGPLLEKVEDLRKYPDEYRFLTPADAIAFANELDGPNDHLVFRPLCGGMDPDRGWESLELFMSNVLPHINKTNPRTT